MKLKEWNDLTKYQRDWVCRYQSLTQIFISKVWNDLTEDQRDRVKSMKLPDKKERTKRARRYAKDHDLKIKDGHLYAYRNHDKRGCGMWDKTRSYKKGKLYRDWHCDPREEVENSFGFGIWPEGNTPVRVPLEDFIVAVNRDDGKARVFAFEMI